MCDRKKTVEIPAQEILHRKKVREMAPEGVVLLKNDGTLPLSGDTKTIALFGRGARKTVMGGTGSGEVTVRGVTTIEQGFENAGIRIPSKEWLDEYDRIYRQSEERYEMQIQEKLDAGVPRFVIAFSFPFQEPQPQPISGEELPGMPGDAACYVVSRISGEGMDRRNAPGDYRLSREEIQNIEVLSSFYEKFILILNTGGPVDLTPVDALDGVNAILLVSQAGDQTGDITADVILGAAYPSGRLTATWAGAYEAYPYGNEFSKENGELDDSWYKEGIYVGYRYFDSFDVAPEYPFGYGLGYTEFEITDTEVLAVGDTVKVSTCVKNTGSHAGREVVQVYVSAPQGKLEKSYQELKAFEKTAELLPGESTKISLSFSVQSLASYEEETASYVLEKGMYEIRVGNHSRNTRIAARLCLKEAVTVQKLKNCFPTDVSFEELSGRAAQAYSYPEEAQEKEVAKVIEIFPEHMKTEVVDYEEQQSLFGKKTWEKAGEKRFLTMGDVLAGRADLQELVCQMRPEELAALCTGTGWLNETGGKSMIGEAALTVPGAAGETIAMPDRKIESLILADGPAGVRIEAYRTALPIAVMLAQSWNREVLFEAGRIAGEEMEESGVDLWLAPGMNIQKNPLCGRNFEYYSEDPLISGQCAASVTRGVQQNPCFGTTVKHFAANSQEENRSYNNGHIHERALREIYLKGFEICVREAAPKAVMTSYNLINGIHSANSRGLLEEVLRKEWKFEGIVMTDWGTTGWGNDPKMKYPCSSPAACMEAGNDLIMPGMQRDMDGILKKYAECEDEKERLDYLNRIRLCAYRILRTAGESSHYKKK